MPPRCGKGLRRCNATRACIPALPARPAPEGTRYYKCPKYDGLNHRQCPNRICYPSQLFTAGDNDPIRLAYNKSSTKLTSLVRGRLTRTKAAKVRRSLHHASTKIAKVARSRLARLKTAKLRRTVAATNLLSKVIRKKIPRIRDTLTRGRRASLERKKLDHHVEHAKKRQVAAHAAVETASATYTAKPTARNKTARDKARTELSSANRAVQTAENGIALFEQGGRLVDVSGDGNCFYYALWGAAHNRGAQPDLTQDIVEAFTDIRPPSPVPEKEFAEFIRSAIARKIRDGRGIEFPQLHAWAFDGNTREEKNNNTDMYNTFRAELSRELKSALTLTSFRRQFPTLSDADKFYSKVADIVNTNLVYVSQIEVDLAKEVLAANGITLHVVSSLPPNLVHVHGGKKQLWLFKPGDSNHYNYYAF